MAVKKEGLGKYTLFAHFFPPFAHPVARFYLDQKAGKTGLKDPFPLAAAALCLLQFVCTSLHLTRNKDVFPRYRNLEEEEEEKL